MEQHKHCKVCEKPIPLDEEFCSEKCRTEYQEFVNKRKKRRYILYGLIIVLFVVGYLTFIY